MSVEHAGGHGPDNITRAGADALRDRDGRWFGIFPATWTPPPIGQGEDQRHAWIVQNARANSVRTPLSGATHGSPHATNGHQAHVVLAELAARGRQQEQQVQALKDPSSPAAQLERLGARLPRLARYEALLMRKDDPWL